MIPQLREIIWDCQDGQCAYCLCELRFDETTFDHVRPRSRGGHSGYNNLVVTCWKCNNDKGDSEPTAVQLAAAKRIRRLVHAKLSNIKQRYRKIEGKRLKRWG